MQAPAISLLTSPGIVLIHNGQEFGEDYFVPESGTDRVVPRPLRWAAHGDDDIGKNLYRFHQKLIGLRAAHPSLRSSNYFPAANQDGYGVFIDIGVVVYHRYGQADDGSFERFIIALNYSDTERFVDIPFSVNGIWQELLNGGLVTIQNFVLQNTLISSNWGKIFFNSTRTVRV